jgi:hypothetical protein
MFGTDGKTIVVMMWSCENYLPEWWICGDEYERVWGACYPEGSVEAAFLPTMWLPLPPPPKESE